MADRMSTRVRMDRIRDNADDKSFLNKYYGFCCFYLGRFEEAVTCLTVALESKPEYKILWHSGLLRRSMIKKK